FAPAGHIHCAESRKPNSAHAHTTWDCRHTWPGRGAARRSVWWRVTRGAGGRISRRRPVRSPVRTRFIWRLGGFCFVAGPDLSNRPDCDGGAAVVRLVAAPQRTGLFGRPSGDPPFVQPSWRPVRPPPPLPF